MIEANASVAGDPVQSQPGCSLAAHGVTAPVAPVLPRKIPSLDGMRAVSVLLVLLGHLEGTRGFGSIHIGHLTLDAVMGDFANLGVRVFFVISGFLITRLLIEERAQYGSVSLRLFYIRRALRIFPAFLAYMLSILVVVGFGRIVLTGGDVAHALTYTVNYQHGPSWYTGHLWSLSVEEQFYLLWPFVVKATGTTWAMGVAAGCLVLGPMARGYMRLFVSPPMYLPSFPTVADCLAVGCVLAGMREAAWRRPTYRRLVSSNATAWVGVALLVLLNRFRVFTAGWVLGESVQNLTIALLLDRWVSSPSRGAARLLNTRPLPWIGRLSYSLYLFQQPFLNRHSASTMSAFPLNLVLACSAALASYYLLERPLMRLRGRLRPITSTVTNVRVQTEVLTSSRA